MLNVYTSMDKVINMKNFVECNDAFFWMITINEAFTEYDYKVIEKIDHARLIKTKGKKIANFETPFGVVDASKLSTGCKTLINMVHHPENVYNLMECGWNVQEMMTKYFSINKVQSNGVYTEARFKIGEKAEVSVNKESIVRSTAEFILMFARENKVWDME
jgi:hypothetical protein